jgi:D-glycero-alpha-D-manno-heptose-7-phosphate kinase
MTTRKIIESSAPTRVDLAGGTVDIWPLYLFHEGAVTVNFAIDLPARCRITSRSDSKIVLRSVDTAESAEFDGLAPLRTTPRLKMLAKLIYFFAPAAGLEMVTECTAPAGSGLAGSSALNIAICGALNVFTGARHDPRTLIEIAKNVEAQVIDVPTGDQDFYPPTYGGVSAIHLTPKGVEREEIAADLDGLAERLVLVFSGQQRNSGINNWEVQKRHIDGDRKVIEAFDGIVRAANRMADALRRGDFDAIHAALDEEWSNRRQLSDGIATPEIDSIIARAKSLGAGSAKICGAGGGGCVVLSVPAGRRRAVERALADDGVRVIDYSIARRGLQLTVSEE